MLSIVSAILLSALVLPDPNPQGWTWSPHLRFTKLAFEIVPTGTLGFAPREESLLADLAPVIPNHPTANTTVSRGIRHLEQVVSLPNGEQAFQIIALEIDLDQINLRPIWSNPTAMTGTSPLTTIVRQWQAIGAINGGFFNRQRQLPVGAIRRDGQWLSGSALNRGAIGWNDQGEVFIDRLSYSEELTANGIKINLTHLNSGFVQRGIARYTPTWGEQYISLTDNEILVQVQNQRVIAQSQASQAGQSQIAIPKDGYILVLRGVPEQLPLLTIGSNLVIKASVSPAHFKDLPHLVAAGPVLLNQGQVSANPASEGFSAAFADQRAVRSAIATTSNPKKLLLLAIPAQERLPTLTETALILKQLGAINALNLDGGSSTSIYLAGRLITPPTNVPIHSAIGLFLRP